MKIEAPRRGARSLDAVPADVLARLEAGAVETVNLMEWLRTDMSALALALGSEIPSLAAPFADAAERMRGLGVTGRLRAIGAVLAVATDRAGADLDALSAHCSDIVRQWACYAVNDSSLPTSVEDRLAATLPFADDRNMSVRETAWMAFRPHLPADTSRMVELLLPLVRSKRENVRRFAVEVTRPRSVWGAHLPVLKREPGLAAALIDAVMTDESRYVRLAVGNWLNDAAKTRPEWVRRYCESWSSRDADRTRFVVKRGLRSIGRRSARPGDPVGLLDGIEGEAA